MPQEPDAPRFFDVYPTFSSTSRTAPFPNRLNKRYRAIFETKPEIYGGARVLDIASPDGRWSFAALKVGAAHVTGIEGRDYLVDSARANFQQYSIDPNVYHFEVGDVFEFMREAGAFDVVMCLRFFYRTHRHPELMKLIGNCRPEYLVIDTSVSLHVGLACLVVKDNADDERDAVSEESTVKGFTYAAHPSIPLLNAFVEDYGFKLIAQADWPSLIGADHSDITDYVTGQRVTWFCQRAVRLSTDAAT